MSNSLALNLIAKLPADDKLLESGSTRDMCTVNSVVTP